MAESNSNRQANVLATTNATARFTPAPPSIQGSPPRVKENATAHGVARLVDRKKSWQRVHRHDWPVDAILP